MTAEELKDALVAYQREHFPAGRSASAMFDTGKGMPPEVLVVTLQTSSDQCGPESRAALARSSS